MLTLAAILTASLIAANDRLGTLPCSIGNPDVRDFVEHQRPWRLVTTADLSSDDIELWNMYHKGNCPGFSIAHIKEREVYALAFYQRDSGKIREKLIFLSSVGKHQNAEIISAPKVVTSPFVVWRAGPGKFTDSSNNRTVSLREDSFVYEKMESISYQYYYQDGRFKRIMASE